MNLKKEKNLRNIISGKFIVHGKFIVYFEHLTAVGGWCRGGGKTPVKKFRVYILKIRNFKAFYQNYLSG